MIKAHDIHKSYGELEVLKGVSLEVKPSEVVSIVGPSGAGKTTLLQILGTLSKMDSGSLTIDSEQVGKLGDDALSDFRNRKIGFVFQFHNLLPEFTALENVMIPALIAGRDRSQTDQEAKRLLDMMQLSERTTHKPSALSGGEQQRVAIARALINRPSVVLADEPTGNLDNKNAERVVELLFDLSRERGHALVIVTHSPTIAAMSDLRYVLRGGLLVQED